MLMMLKKIENRIMLLLTFLLLPVLSACKTDYTPNAVERAREFALENAKQLNAEQRNYIRYNDPSVAENVIFKDEGFDLEEYGHLSRNSVYKKASSERYDKMHSCMIWTLPGTADSVVVAGEGERSMRFWNPIKVIIKKYTGPDALYQEARKNAIAYVTNNMLYLSDDERNRVRFSDPEVYKSSFDISFAVKKDDSVKTEWEEYLGDISKKTEPVQFSLVWKADDPQKRVVVSGLSKGNNLSGWNPLAGMLLKKQDVDSSTLLFTPADKQLESAEKTVPQQTKKD